MYGYRVGNGALLALPILGVLTGVPLALGLISRNHIYGIRTAGSLATDGAWYAINKRGGYAMIIASLVSLIVMLAIQKRMADAPSSLLLQVGVFTICLAAGIGLSLGFHG